MSSHALDPGHVASQALDLDQGWGVGEETFERIAAEIRRIDARTIVEFGSGISSVRLALEFPRARILSLESNLQWYETVCRMRGEHGAGPNLTVSHRPLRWQIHAGALFLSYGRGAFPDSVDAVIIDGPPTWTRRGREACLYQIYPHLALGGKIFLDDYGRNREKTIVRNWMLSYPESFSMSTIETGHGVCVLEKKSDVRQPRLSMRSLPDHIIEALGVWFSHPWRR